MKDLLEEIMNGHSDNFLSAEELTVTITLNEYRNLIRSEATRIEAINEANKNKWDRDAENNKLKNEVSELKQKVYDLQKKLTERETNEEVKHPCQNCVYAQACGDNSRTENCDGRMTKTERKNNENNIPSDR